MADLQSVAGQVATVDETVLKFLPFISMFIAATPAGPFMPLITEALTALDSAAKAVAGGNTSGAIDVVIKEVISHLTPGMPNSPALAPAGEAVPPMPPAPSGS